MNEDRHVFRIPKSTGTHADVFLAVGLADLLQSIFEEPVELRDDGSFFFVFNPCSNPENN